MGLQITIFKLRGWSGFTNTMLKLRDWKGLTIITMLSNDPGKNCTIFYCSAEIRFPHFETVLFSDQEFIN